MDTVLGLAITSSTIGWVIADGGGSGCPTVAGDEVGVAGGDTEPDAAELGAAACAVATGLRAMVTSRGERLHGVAVTWSDDASVGAALLLESLADAGFDHVVPVRYSQAAASLADGISTRLGRRPESVPAFVQVGAQQALARGAALTLAPHTELTGAPLAATAAGLTIGNVGRRRVRSRSYAAALLMLAAGAVTFVASVAAALSLQLGTGREAPSVPAPQHATVARVAVPAAPPAAAPAPSPAATDPPGEVPAEAPAEFGSLWDAPEIEPGTPAPMPDGHPSLVDRVREHVFGPIGR